MCVGFGCVGVIRFHSKTMDSENKHGIGDTLFYQFLFTNEATEEEEEGETLAKPFAPINHKGFCASRIQLGRLSNANDFPCFFFFFHLQLCCVYVAVLVCYCQDSKPLPFIVPCTLRCTRCNNLTIA